MREGREKGRRYRQGVRMGYLRIERDDLASSFARKLRYAHTRTRKRESGLSEWARYLQLI